MKCVDPSITRKLVLGTNNYLLNDKNYLKDFTNWDEQLRDWLASEEQLMLGTEHLHIMDFLRTNFSQNGRHPVLRLVTTEMTKQFGKEKGNVKYFHSLFPGGIHQAFLVAGLPMQDSCC